MLAHHDLHRRLELGEDFLAQLEFRGPAKLGQVAAEQHEVGLRIERVNVLHGPDRRPHEALVERALVKMGVGDVGDAERGAALLAHGTEILLRRCVGKLD